VEREARVYRRLWRGSAFSSLLLPLLFLAAMGVGLGGLVDERTSGVSGLSYLHFVTPGLLAAAAMQEAAAQALWPIMAGHKWIKFHYGMVATPLRPTDVYGGTILWISIRALISATIFLVVAALLGGVASPWGVLAIPAAVLCAAAFAAPLAAFAATQDTDLRFPLIMRLGVLPLFLFSATFFPLSQLPGWLQPVAVLSPLWHGVELCRDATTGDFRPLADLAHVAALAACITAGALWGSRTFTERLCQ
jgi:lipooligosaccharide transport system permease protein